MLILLICLSIIFLSLLVWGIFKPHKVFLGNKSTKEKVIKFYGLALFVDLIATILVFVFPTSEISAIAADLSTPTMAATARTETQASSSEANKIEIPALEALFTSIIIEAQRANNTAENDMQRGGIKSIRDKNICKAMPSLHVNNWIGVVENVSANTNGKGILAIKVADNITIETYNNEFSDTESRTLIEPETALFTRASMLKIGQLVKFSGNFFNGGSSECLNEASFTLAGKLSDPEFIFRFSNVTPL